MKKSILFLFVLCMLGGSKVQAQSPACLVAAKLTPVPQPAGPDVDTIISSPQGEKWFKFAAIKEGVTINVTSFLTALGYRTDKIELYKGTCSSLAFLGKDSLSGVTDSTFSVYADSLALTDSLFLRTTCISNSYCGGCGNSNLKFQLEIFFDPGDPHNCVTCTTMTNCNLVCNGDFEQHNPNGISATFNNISNACGWSDVLPATTCDYYHTSTPFGNNTSAPCSGAGIETPHGGQGYAGFVVGQGNLNNAPWYEYMKTQLLAPLTPNQTYTVSFWLSQAEKSRLHIGNVGVYFYSNPGIQQSVQEATRPYRVPPHGLQKLEYLLPVPPIIPTILKAISMVCTTVRTET
ncbi:MAG: hypothetical protein K0S33_1150 [Bacteroidetes bacterium]|jgi:hypothetical protein|nr:hypothetical protein [Bacteroidota bacterium]